MVESPLFKMIWDMQLWQEAIDKGIVKGIDDTALFNLCNPRERTKMKIAMYNGTLMFEPPHEAEIPKDEPGKFRIVIVSAPQARVLDAIINFCLFRLYGEKHVHKSSKAYQIGLSTGKVAEEVSEKLKDILVLSPKKQIGWKYDFSRFFDTVAKEKIFHLFDELEREEGCEKNTCPVFNYLRRIWNCDYVIDLEKHLVQRWMGIRQGNAVSAFLANAILYELDEFMTEKYYYYVRYSDDLIVLDISLDNITSDINNIISKYNVTLNPKKVQPLMRDEWFKFLGYTFKGNQISLSQRRIHDFSEEIADLTYRQKGISYEKALHNVYKKLYFGDKEGHCWAAAVYRYCNSESDLQYMNNYIQDCLRAVINHNSVGYGLGYNPKGANGVIPFNKGKHVKRNREKVAVLIGWKPMKCLRNALLTNRAVFDTLIREVG